MKRMTTVQLALTLTCCSAILYPLIGFAGHTNTVLVAEMDGREEVDSTNPAQRLVGDPNGKGEAYVFGIDGDPTTLCYVLEVENIQLVPVGSGIAAHIHEGVRDTNGPVVAVLAGPEDGDAADCLTEGEEGKFPTGESGIVSRILENPTNFYINIHNPEYPGGAIRGNLSYLIEENHTHDDDSTNGAPTAPANLTAAVYSKTAAEIFWDRSSDDGFISTYIIVRDGLEYARTDGNSFYENELTAGTTYRYSVIAVDDAGNQSSESNVVDVQL